MTSADHPLVRLDAPERTLERILAEPLLLLGETARLRKVLERMFMQRGISVQAKIEIESIEGLKELVRQGCGVTFMPPALLWRAQLNDGLALLPIADVTETFIFALVYRRAGSLTVPARQFMNTVVETTSV